MIEFTDEEKFVAAVRLSLWEDDGKPSLATVGLSEFYYAKAKKVYAAVAPLIEAQVRAEMDQATLYAHADAQLVCENVALRSDLAQARAAAIEEAAKARLDMLRIFDSYASPNHDDWFYEMRKKLAASCPVSEREGQP